MDFRNEQEGEMRWQRKYTLEQINVLDVKKKEKSMQRIYASVVIWY